MTVINLNEIKFVNWNANDIKSKKSILIEFLSRHKIDIACIRETHFKNTDPLKINGFNIYITDRDSNHFSGGLEILIKKILNNPPNKKIQMKIYLNYLNINQLYSWVTKIIKPEAVFKQTKNNKLLKITSVQ